MTDSLDLLFLTQTYPRHARDIAGPFIRDLASGLVRLGDRVTVLTPHAPGLEPRWQDAGVAVETFRYAPESWEVLGYGRSLERDESIRLRAGLVTPLYLKAAGQAVHRVVLRDGVDLIQAHWIVPNAVALTLPFRQRLDVPMAVGLHGSDVFLAERPLVRRLVTRALRRTVVLTGCSPELVERVRRLADRELLSRVIPYGVDTQIFKPGVDRAGWRERLRIADEDEVLLSVGRLASKKGFHVLIDCLPELLERRPSLHVVVAGGGDLEGRLRERTERFRSRVHLPGSVERDVLPDLYRAADVFVLPAVHDRKGNVDGLPNVILEAMASGLAVVASDISGIPLAIDSESEGVLVAEQDSRALIEALVRMFEDPVTRRACGERARARAERELTWDAVAARYREAYLAGLSTDREPHVQADLSFRGGG